MYLGLNRISLSFIVNNVFERNLVFNLHLLLFMLTDIFLSFSSFHYPYNVKIWMAIVFGFLFFKGIYSLRKSNFEFIFLLLYLFFPIIFTYFFIWPFKHVYAIRYFLVFSPPYYIFLSAGLLSLKNIRYKSITILSFCFILSNVITLNFLSLHNFPKQRGEDWRTLANYIKEKSLASDIIIFDRGKMMPAFDYYFKSPVPCIGFVAPKESDGEYREYERDIKLALEMIAQEYERIWVIRAPWSKRFNLSEQLLGRYFILEEKISFGIEALLYKKREGAIFAQNRESLVRNEIQINPCNLQKSIAYGEYVIQSIDFSETGVYNLFIAAQSSDAFPFYCNMELILDNKIIAFYNVGAGFAKLYKTETFINKGQHQIKITCAKDKYDFNKKRRLFLGEVMFMHNSGI